RLFCFVYCHAGLCYLYSFPTRRSSDLGAAGQHHVVAVLVQLDDLRLDLAADVGLQIADATHLDQRSREEPTQADVEDQAALDDRSEEHTSELQSRENLVCRLLLEKKNY